MPLCQISCQFCVGSKNFDGNRKIHHLANMWWNTESTIYYFFWNYNHWSETDKKLALKLHFSYSRVQLGTESCYNLQHRKNTLLHKLRTKANIHCFVSFGFIYRNKAWSGNIFSLHCLQPIHRNGMHQIINVVLICYWVPHFPLLSVPLWFLRSCLLSFQ